MGDEELFNLFRPDRNPRLVAGYVDEDLQATPEEMRAANVLLQQRRARFAWRDGTLSEDERAAVESLAEEVGEQLKLATRVDLAKPIPMRPLPFLDGGKLIHLEPSRAQEGGRQRPDVISENRRIMLCRSIASSKDAPVYRAFWLNGEAQPFHRAIVETVDGRHQTVFQPAAFGAKEEYLKIFGEHVFAEDGAFHIIEGLLPDLPSEAGQSDDAMQGALSEYEVDADNIFYRRPFEFLGTQADPPMLEGKPLEVVLERAVLKQPITKSHSPQYGEFFVATVVFSANAFRSAFTVDHQGQVEMLADDFVPNVSLTQLMSRWTIQR